MLGERSGEGNGAAAPQARDPDVAVQRFRERGFLVLSGFLPQEMLERLRRECALCIDAQQSASAVIKSCLLYTSDAADD